MAIATQILSEGILSMSNSRIIPEENTWTTSEALASERRVKE
jgi:hypothetical protein